MEAIKEKNSSAMKVNKAYIKPAIEVIEMKVEGILCASGGDLPPGGGWGD